jgi:hypothetical protein
MHEQHFHKRKFSSHINANRLLANITHHNSFHAVLCASTGEGEGMEGEGNGKEGKIREWNGE